MGGEQVQGSLRSVNCVLVVLLLVLVVLFPLIVVIT